MQVISTCAGSFLGLLGDAGATPFTLAYLDAGTGSMVFQWIVAGLLGGAFAFRTSWKHITSAFSRKKNAEAEDV